MGTVSAAALLLQDTATNDTFEFSDMLTLVWWVEKFGGTLLRVAIITLLALIIRAILVRAVDKVVRRIADLHTRRDANTSRAAIVAARKAQRTKTLGSLFKNVVNIVVLGIAGLMILAEVGINLGPLLAGAGVAGVAIGFGAQSLVKDIISGMFILMEDQYGVGDVVDLGDATGTVEEVQLRITKLRAVDGTLWFVRNGEVLRVGNMSQDYSKVVLDVGVAYGTDVEQAKEVLQRVANDFAADPETRRLVLETPEVLGVQALAPDSVQIRLVITTQPGEQWAASRMLRERIKGALDEAGIEIPFPQQVMWMRQFPQGQGSGQQASAPQAPGSAD